MRARWRDYIFYDVYVHETRVPAQMLRLHTFAQLTNSDRDNIHAFFMNESVFDYHTLKQPYPIEESSFPLADALYTDARGPMYIPYVSTMSLAYNNDRNVIDAIKTQPFAKGGVFEARRVMFQNNGAVLLTDKYPRLHSAVWSRHAIDLVARLSLACAPKLYAVGLTPQDKYALIVEDRGRALEDGEAPSKAAVSRVMDELRSLGWRAGDIANRANWVVSPEDGSYSFVDYNTLYRFNPHDEPDLDVSAAKIVEMLCPYGLVM